MASQLFSPWFRRFHPQQIHDKGLVIKRAKSNVSSCQNCSTNSVHRADAGEYRCSLSINNKTIESQPIFLQVEGEFHSVPCMHACHKGVMARQRFSLVSQACQCSQNTQRTWTSRETRLSICHVWQKDLQSLFRSVGFVMDCYIVTFRTLPATSMFQVRPWGNIPLFLWQTCRGHAGISFWAFFLSLLVFPER